MNSSFAWERVGSFKTCQEAEEWCRRQGIAWGDSRINDLNDGIELLVRSSALDPDDRTRRPWQ